MIPPSTPALIKEVLRRHALGEKPQVIARALGIPRSSVYTFVARYKIGVEDRKTRPRERKTTEIIHGAGPDRCFIAPHEARPPAKLLNRDAVMPAARAFAAGKISREELMRRITR